MRIVITCGPSFSPIDSVRRLTNASTGELGTLLSEAFAEQGGEVTLFRATGSTYAAPLWPVNTIPFSTNEDLARALENIPDRLNVTAVFHAAALCDFIVREIVTEGGQPLEEGKFSSRSGPVRLTLDPAPKLIQNLRSLFPNSLVVGWKFEVEGKMDSVIRRGQEQIEECLTDACVLNGNAYGQGFGVLGRNGERVHLATKPTLCQFLCEWLGRIPSGQRPSGPESFHALATLLPLGKFF